MIDDLARGEDTNPSVCLLLVTRESMVDIDLVNSLQSLLEDQGILNDIRAKLRSGVLHLLKNNANNNDSSIKSKTKSAVGAFVSRHGTAALELCFDLLTALELHETLSVLQAESGFVSYLPIIRYYDSIHLRFSMGRTTLPLSFDSKRKCN